MLLILLVVAPILIGAIAWFLGRNMSPIAFGGTFLFSICAALLTFTFLAKDQLILGIVLSLLIFAFTPLFSVAFGVDFGKTVTPSPHERVQTKVAQAKEAYEKLDPELKIEIGIKTRSALKSILRYGAQKLDEKGRGAEATLLRDGENLL